jgi:hypothetical protein
MDQREFNYLRRTFDKTQKQMAELLGTSLKAIQSFEQGWRRIPIHIERQMFFLLTQKQGMAKKGKPCWDIRNCSLETREVCPAWEFQVGHLCWFINGTICRGKPQETWKQKMKLCRQCEVFASAFPALQKDPILLWTQADKRMSSLGLKRNQTAPKIQTGAKKLR